MTSSPQKSPDSSQEAEVERTWTIQIPHPLDGQMKCNCESRRNTARLFMSNTKTNPTRQFFRCPNSTGPTTTECGYFKWADTVSGPGIPSSGPSTSNVSTQPYQSTPPSSGQASASTSFSSATVTAPTIKANAMSPNSVATPKKFRPSIAKGTPRTPRTKEQEEARMKRLAMALEKTETENSTRDEHLAPPSVPASNNSNAGADFREPLGSSPPASPPPFSPFPRHVSDLSSQSQDAPTILYDHRGDSGSDDDMEDSISQWPTPSPSRSSNITPLRRSNFASSEETGPSRSGGSVVASGLASSRYQSADEREGRSGLPTPRKSPLSSSSVTEDSSDRQSASKRKRQEMEDIEHNPFYEPSLPGSRLSGGFTGPSRITVLERRMDEFAAISEDLKTLVHQQAATIAEQDKTIQHLTNHAAKTVREITLLQREVERHDNHLFSLPSSR